MLVGHAASHKDEDIHIMLSDVKRACFHAPATRELYVEVPREDPNWQPSVLARLKLSLFGTRNAAANWQKCDADGLTQSKLQAGPVESVRLLASQTWDQDLSPR